MRYLISTVETYRVNSESDVEALIAEAKNASEYELAKYTREYKEKKSKGEVVDAWFKVTLTKKFTDEKEPDRNVEVSYE
jgi:hypothetical protein